MHSKDKPPLVYIGGEYYSTEKQMKDYFNSKTEYKKNEKSVTRYKWSKDDDAELHLFYKDRKWICLRWEEQSLKSLLIVNNRQLKM